MNSFYLKVYMPGWILDLPIFHIFATIRQSVESVDPSQVEFVIGISLMGSALRGLIRRMSVRATRSSSIELSVSD